MQTRHPGLARWSFGACVAVSLAALVWPGPQLFAARVEPFVLGVPFGFAWTVGWLLVTFVALVAYHLSTGEEG